MKKRKLKKEAKLLLLLMILLLIVILLIIAVNAVVFNDTNSQNNVFENNIKENIKRKFQDNKLVLVDEVIELDVKTMMTKITKMKTIIATMIIIKTMKIKTTQMVLSKGRKM